jgi:HEAT repeat protein
MRSLPALVDHYLTEWGSSRWGGAYHSLVELGPQILPELEARFADSPSPAFRAELAQIGRQLRSEDALALFRMALQDEAPVVWKEALDGLVALASTAAIQLLEQALEDPPAPADFSEWQAWIGEALEQARLAHRARDGVA